MAHVGTCPHAPTRILEPRGHQRCTKALRPRNENSFAFATWATQVQKHEPGSLKPKIGRWSKRQAGTRVRQTEKPELRRAPNLSLYRTWPVRHWALHRMPLQMDRESHNWIPSGCGCGCLPTGSGPGRPNGLAVCSSRSRCAGMSGP
eukprot:2575422-Pyramimonas_sp.AAC.1